MIIFYGKVETIFSVQHFPMHLIIILLTFFEVVVVVGVISCVAPVIMSAHTFLDSTYL
jgi:hypothetical protein